MTLEQLNETIEDFGKFEGQRVALRVAYENSLDGSCDSFGDVGECGFYCASYVEADCGKQLDIWFVEDSQGFVSEISEADFDEAAHEDANRRENEEYEEGEG